MDQIELHSFFRVFYNPSYLFPVRKYNKRRHVRHVILLRQSVAALFRPVDAVQLDVRFRNVSQGDGFTQVEFSHRQ